MNPKEVLFYKSLQSFTCAVKNDDLYFYTGFHDFVRMNLKTCDTQFIKSIQKGEKEDYVFGIFIISDKIYYLSRGGRQIIEEGTGKRIPLLSGKEQGEYVLFSTQYRDEIFVLYSNGMLFFDIDVRHGKYKSVDLNPWFHIRDAEIDTVECSGLYENKLFFFLRYNRHLICYDLEKGECVEIPLPDIKRNIIYFTYQEQEMVLLYPEGEIYLWDLRDHAVRLLWRAADIDQSYRYGRFHILKDRIILLPTVFGEDILILDRNFHWIGRYDDYPDDFAYIMGDPYHYARYAETENEIIYPMRSANYVMIISQKTGNINWVRPAMESVRSMQAYFQKEHPGILFLAEGVVDVDLERTERKRERGETVGSKIHRYMQGSGRD